jgi:UDP-N-acetylglucosamine diphosphorylase/glucosamine-1-phosphate N-acetyltransferase
MSIILFDNALSKHLQPLTTNKAVASLRFGILSVKERWEKLSGEAVYVHTEKNLQQLYPAAPTGDHCWIDASLVPDIELADSILTLEHGHCLADEFGLLGGRTSISFDAFAGDRSLESFENIRDHKLAKRIEYPWQLMQWNDAVIRFDFALLTKGRKSQPLSGTVNAIQPENIFVEEGAVLEYCTINASTGPVYIGKNALVMEGSAIRGPFVLGDHAVLKMNSRVYGATTLGPYCLGGGEIKNAVMMGYSNKAHDGYLGDSVVGEWCNFGAGATNSNIKNTAGEVKVWAMGAGKQIAAGNKCGVIMGDYSRVAINSSINTGSVIGVGCNVFGQGLLPSVIPHFSWGVNGDRYLFDKAIQDINNWKKLKDKVLSEAEINLLKTIFEKL